MVQSSLRVKPRKRIGKSGAREVRKEGNIPAILYGGGENPVPLVVRPEDLKQALSGSGGINTILELEIDGSEPPVKKFSMLQEVQRDPLKDKVIHLDFLEIDMQKIIKVAVPVTTLGRSEGERRGGKLEKLMRAVDIECLPTDIPDSIEIDVNDLEIGDFIDISGLSLGEKTRPLRGEKEKVIQVVGQRLMEDEETEEEQETETGAEDEAE